MVRTTTIFAIALLSACNGSGDGSSSLPPEPPPPPQPAMALSVSSLSFQPEVVGTSSVAQWFTVTNTGNGSLVITSVTLGGHDSSSFTETNNCGTSLAASQICTVDVTFKPDLAGDRNAEIQISATSVSSKSVSLTGLGATGVGGTIANSTHWTLAGSPYLATSDVLLPIGVTLTIDAGVRVEGGSYMIQIAGTFDVAGTADEPVVLNDVNISPASPGTPTVIQFAHLTGGQLFAPSPGGENIAGLIVTDSVLRDVGSTIYLPMRGSPGCGISCPLSRLERNVFYHCGGISYAVSYYLSQPSGPFLIIRNNVFQEMTGQTTSGAAIENEYSDYSDPGSATVQFNSFLTPGKYAVGLHTGNDSAQMDAANNYWGTAAEEVIQSMIFDKHVDLNSPGFINFMPFLLSPDPATPPPL